MEVKIYDRLDEVTQIVNSNKTVKSPSTPISYLNGQDGTVNKKIKQKKAQFSTKKEKKEHSINMIEKRKYREYLKPTKITERLMKQRILSKRYRDKKKLESQEKDAELKRISISKKTEQVNIEALKGLGKVQKYQDDQARKNREESARIGKLRKELDEERYDFEMEKGQLAIREKALKVREQEIQIRENLIIKKKELE